MQHTPISKIRRALELAGVNRRRSPRWIEEAQASHIARMDEARNRLNVR